MQKSENNIRTFAFLFQCSSEYKSLLLSGLYHQLKKKHNVIGIMQDCSSIYLDEYSHDYDFEVYKFSEQYFQHKELRIEQIAAASRKARHRIKKIGNFGYFSIDRPIKWIDHILGNYFVYLILHLLTLIQIRKNYKCKDILEIYKKIGITDLVLCGYANAGNKLFAVNAQHANTNVWITLSNWKDLYVNNFIPFSPTKIFSWNNEMKTEYLKRNFHLSSKSFSTIGNPAFDRFYAFTPKYNRDYYNLKYDIGSNQPILLYTMLAPDAYPYEIESILLINDMLNTLYPNKNNRPCILLRRNPLDTVNLHQSHLDANSIFADHYFEGNKEKGIIIQSHEGEDEWLDLIYHSSIVINVASTVTLEALMLNTPVINIEFNGDGANEPFLKKFTEAPFYVPLLNRQDTKVCRTIVEFKSALLYYLGNNEYEIAVPSIIGSFDGQASQRMIETMLLEDNI